MNIKISKEEYDELVESKQYADDMLNILKRLISKTDLDNGDVRHSNWGSVTLPLTRSLLEKRKK